MQYDSLFKNGLLIDGTGTLKTKKDLATLNGKIAKIDDSIEELAVNTYDINDMVISPGFIDMHSHSDISLQFDKILESAIRQGITTQVIGNCGWSLAPVKQTTVELLKHDFEIFLPTTCKLDFKWDSFAEYLAMLNASKFSLNIIPLVGFSAIRIAGGPGYENRPPSDLELNRMKFLVDEAMQSGAFGLSTGLVYAPQSYSKTSEIISLVEVLTKYDGVYFSHIRGESNTVLEAINEFIHILEKSGLIKGQIAHHKVSGDQNWGLSKKTLDLIDKANEKGLDITLDQYPFNRGMTSLISLLPDSVQEGGLKKSIVRLKDSNFRKKLEKELATQDNRIKNVLWNQIYITTTKTVQEKVLEGKTIAEITKERNKSSNISTFLDILIEEEGEVVMQLQTMNEEDIQRIMSHPKTMIGTDSWGISSNSPLSHGLLHPRFYGTFPRILGHYVREKQLLSLEEAIRKMSGLPASKLKLDNRGFLKEGMWGDIVVFDPLKIRNCATYSENRYPSGIVHVLVNGKFVIKNQNLTGELPGKILKRTSDDSLNNQVI